MRVKKVRNNSDKSSLFEFLIELYSITTTCSIGVQLDQPPNP